MRWNISVRCWLIGLVMVVTSGWMNQRLWADAAEPVFQPDGSIKSTKATMTMDNDGVILIVDGAGGTHHLHLAMNYRKSDNTCGSWFSTSSTTQKVKSFDSQTRTTSFYGVIVPPAGSYDTTPIPFCYWMHLKDDGKIRIAVEYDTSTAILQPLYNVHMKDHARPRSGFVGHYMMADSNSYLISSSDPIGARILYGGSIQTATILSDVPDQMIRLHKVASGGERIVDFNSVIDPYFEVRYELTSVMANRMEYDVQLPDEPATIVSATPVFQSDGRIISGQTSLTMTSAGDIQLADSMGIIYSLHMAMVFRSNGTWFCCGSTSTVTNTLKTVDTVNQKVIFSGTIQPAAGSSDMTPIPMSFWMQLQSNGKVRIQSQFTRTGSIYDILSSCELKSHSRPRTGYSSHTIQADSSSFVIANEPPNGTTRTVLKSGSVQDVRFLTDSPLQTVVMSKVTSTAELLADYNVTNTTPFVEMRYAANGTLNQVAIDVTFPPVSTNPSSETYGGVDFWNSDNLRMPSFGKSTNLISNPSFEHDLLYWRWGFTGVVTASSIDRHYVIDNTTAYQGTRSLKIIGKQGQRIAHLSGFAVPVESGQTYTFSFYAKTDNTSVARLWLAGNTARLGTWISLPYSVMLTASWQRYTYTFTAPNGVLGLGFAISDPMADCNVWIDAVQLEKASSATSFVQRALVMSLQTDHWGNLYQPGETPVASVRITGASGTNGTLNIYVGDLAGNETKKQTSTFAIGSNGEVSVFQTWTSGLPQGVYIARMEATVGSTTYRDFGRIAVMPSVPLSQAGRQFFAMHEGDRLRYAEWNRQLAYYTKLGIGSAIYFNPAPASHYSLLSQYQMTHFSSIFEDGQSVASLNISLRTDYDLTATERANLQTYAYNKALANPQITYWKLMNEPDTTHTDATRMGQMLATLQATAAGIKQANPNAKVMTNDPWNMNPTNGINYIDSFLQYGGGTFCDIVAIHPYRTKPESPDIDSDCAALMQVLQNRSFTGDVWFTEGIYHQNYVLPVYGLNTHVGCSSDGYLGGGPFTYDMGWGERMCAAYTARSWLAAMKYGNRVKLYVDWGIADNTILDYSFTPTASVFSVNTLIHTLGGATYQGQPVINASIRSYVFTDTNSYHVAPVWYYSYETDMGQSIPGTLDVSNLLSQYGSSNIELIDFAGNVTALPTSVTLEPWPIFIRAKTGTASQFINALNQAIFHQDYTP